jgi:hypothetical protein
VDDDDSQESRREKRSKKKKQKMKQKMKQNGRLPAESVPVVGDMSLMFTLVAEGR